MLDRFKFRIWDKKNKKIRNIDSIAFDDVDGSIKLINSWGKDIIENKDIILRRENNYFNLLQCTGLKDKNGKLIFEGDIVKVCGTEELGITEIDIKENCIIKWGEKSALYFCDVINKREIKLTEHGYYDFDYFPLFQNESDEEMFDFEIIGNIYENQELLGE